MTRVRRSRGLLWLLLAAALFMRALVPQGYMAESDAAGAITVKVCGSGHFLKVPLGTGETPDADERAQPPCTFAGFGASALPPPAFAEFPVTSAVEAAHVAPVGAAPRFAAPRRLPPARGPPLAA
jgi:hypothetical protein